VREHDGEPACAERPGERGGVSHDVLHRVRERVADGRLLQVDDDQGGTRVQRFHASEPAPKVTTTSSAASGVRAAAGRLTYVQFRILSWLAPTDQDRMRMHELAHGG